MNWGTTVVAAGAGRIGITQALSELARVGLAYAPIPEPAPPRQVLNTILVAGWLIAVAAIIAVGVAAAIRWPAASASLAYRAGYAVGVAWIRLRTFGTWLVDGVKRMIE